MTMTAAKSVPSLSGIPRRIMAGTSPLVKALQQELSKYPGLDARAVLAIASHEGLSGGIGDGGHAFGPFQLNNAGGVITGKFQGQSAGQINHWAWTPGGIDYALNAIDKAAGGLHGLPAIQAITNRFERPANPGAEIADASRHYGGIPTGGMAPAGGSAFQLPSSPLNAALPHPGGPAGAGGAPQGPGPSPVLAALRYLGFNPGHL